MRIIEPHQFKARSSQRKLPLVIGLCAVAIVAVGAAIAQRQTAKPQNNQSGQTIITTAANKAAPKQKPKTFTGNEFRDLYRRVVQTYPNTRSFPEPPAITGSAAADEHIRTLAEGRGFLPTRIPVSALIKTNEHLLKGETDDLLQPLAYNAWLDLKEAAKKDGIPLALLSAYRSPEWQRDLFLDRLGSVSADSIASGNADSAVDATLGRTSVPGYSRHHTGFTVDFWCEDSSGQFANSSCHRWLSADNYLHAKQAGWIPSYPEGADEQGPEPEPWEYVWVGRDVLFE